MEDNYDEIVELNVELKYIDVNIRKKLERCNEKYRHYLKGQYAGGFLLLHYQELVRAMIPTGRYKKKDIRKMEEKKYG